MIGKTKNSSKDHRFEYNLHSPMMMIVMENIPWNIYVWNVIFDEK